MNMKTALTDITQKFYNFRFGKLKNLAPGIPIHAQKMEARKKSLSLYIHKTSGLLTVQCVSAIIPLLICNAFAPVFSSIPNKKRNIFCVYTISES